VLVALGERAGARGEPAVHPAAERLVALQPLEQLGFRLKKKRASVGSSARIRSRIATLLRPFRGRVRSRRVLRRALAAPTT
jgi:hypothetical protein